jgi:5-(carboxyamino)imidazole ribonucleotide synthase
LTDPAASRNTGPALPPGSTIGILGGGQLGRMTAMAAAQLGYRTVILTPETDAPAAQVTDRTILADYDNEEALTRFAELVDVATYEFENVPVEPVNWLTERVPVRPGPRVLRIAQERLREKDFITRLGIGTTRYRAATSFAVLPNILADIGRPAVLKSNMLGYDGKGQATIGDDTDLALAWRQMGAATGIVEKFVDFAYEASIIVARGLDGAMSCFAPVENRHRNHILAETIVPAPMSPETAAAAEAIARRIAEALDLVGLVCVELFVTKEGELLVNEIAPRPHNSGHWTIDACVTSQFEQLVRAMTGLPLGSTERLADARMDNLLGDEIERWPEILADPRAKLHLYGKTESRPGRKMGHVTRLFPRPHQG